MADDANRLLASLELASQIEAQEKRHLKQTSALLLSLVEVQDSFDRFLAASEPAEGQAAVRLIARQLEQALQAAGVTRIACLGAQAQPGLHEVLGAREAAGVAEDEIVEVPWCGYLWDGEILRKPRVIVARAGRQESGKGE